MANSRASKNLAHQMVSKSILKVASDPLTYKRIPFEKIKVKKPPTRKSYYENWKGTIGIGVGP